MDGDEARIGAVLRELADLGRRIGEKAGELARLARERQRSGPTAPPPPTAAMPTVDAVVGAADDLARGAAALTSGIGHAALEREGNTVRRSRRTAMPSPTRWSASRGSAGRRRRRGRRFARGAGTARRRLGLGPLVASTEIGRAHV